MFEPLLNILHLGVKSKLKPFWLLHLAISKDNSSTTDASRDRQSFGQVYEQLGKLDQVAPNHSMQLMLSTACCLVSFLLHSYTKALSNMVFYHQEKIWMFYHLHPEWHKEYLGQ